MTPLAPAWSAAYDCTRTSYDDAAELRDAKADYLGDNTDQHPHDGPPITRTRGCTCDVWAAELGTCARHGGAA